MNPGDAAPAPWSADRSDQDRAHVALRAASSTAPDATAAVREVATALGDDAQLYLAFVPERYDWNEAADALTRWAGGRVVACTSAGGIGPRGFVRDGLVAVSLSGEDLTVHTVPITPLSDLDTAWALTKRQLSTIAESRTGVAAFALLVVDGLSMAEEKLAEGLLAWLGHGIPLIGGSAGDNLRFARSRVLVDGRLVPDAATVTVVTTHAAFRLLRIQHHVAGDTVLVVTSTTPRQRLVHTLNGLPAAEEYAAAVGITAEQLTPEVFSAHPLIVRSGKAEWIRSISRVEPDGSLRFLSSAERGTALRLASTTSPVKALENAFAQAQEELGVVTGALVFDCVLRRLEFESTGITADVEAVLQRFGAVGFSTYGEQYGGVHVNQTMVGLAFGK